MMNCADINGFSLRAAVRCDADDCQGMERLCRYITCPALADERVQYDPAGPVVLKLKTPWRDGTTHRVKSGSADIAHGASRSYPACLSQDLMP
jgi:hypothetical protein